MAAARKSTTRSPAGERTDNRAASSGKRSGAADLPLAGVAKQVRAWADSVLGVAGAAADISIGAAKAVLV